MRMLYMLHQPERIRGRSKLKTILILAFIAIIGCLNQTYAQSRHNQSDWNVPPPLTPGTINKGNGNGNGTAGKSPVLSLSDIPSIPQPFVSSVPAPLLAAVSTTAPAVTAPDQPVLVTAGVLPGIPSPDAPETPSLPKQSMKDLPVLAAIDLPVPEAPELPGSPAEPAASVLGAVSKGSIPVMPDVLGAALLSLPQGDVTPWSTPLIPESMSFKLVMPAETKSNRSGDKGTKKGKSKSPGSK